jgi:hypothetical protein
VRYLVDEGLLDLHKSVLTEPDVVTDTSVDREGRMYSADLGAAVTTDTADLDPAVWRPVHKDIALLSRAATARNPPRKWYKSARHWNESAFSCHSAVSSSAMQIAICQQSRTVGRTIASRCYPATGS